MRLGNQPYEIRGLSKRAELLANTESQAFLHCGGPLPLLVNLSIYTDKRP
jgi:hypothetical protein